MKECRDAKDLKSKRFHLTGLKIDKFSKEKMDASAKELAEEKTLAYYCLD